MKKGMFWPHPQPPPLGGGGGVGGEASVNSVCRRPSVGSKQCAKKLRELCALCERKNSPA